MKWGELCELKPWGEKRHGHREKGKKNGSCSLFMGNNVQFAYGLIENIFKPSKHGQLWKLERP